MLRSDKKSNNLILTQDELKAATGYDSPADIAACLARQGVKFLKVKRGRIFTTISAIELAMKVDEVNIEVKREVLV